LGVLTSIAEAPEKPIRNAAVAIVAAKYNSTYTDALVESARRELKAGGVTRIEVVRVPGSFEIPVVAARLTKTNDPQFEAIICFGAILQGETTHAENIADAVSHALAQLQVSSGKPIIHGVLLFENEEQAEIRCLGTEHNRGVEAGRTALDMIRVMRALQNFDRDDSIF
jgi:6,7-dimethyl-8-ribityllumazine synthase